MVKKLMLILLVAALTAGYASVAFSARAAGSAETAAAVQEVKEEKAEHCTVLEIKETKVFLQNNKEEQFAMNVKDPETLKSLKVGDRVMIKNGKVSKEK